MTVSTQPRQVATPSELSQPPLAAQATGAEKAPKTPSLEWQSLPDYENVLLLQGPVGPFFQKLANYWHERGAQVHKINFNPGDDYFYAPTQAKTVQYRHRFEFWEAFVQHYLTSEKIDAVFLFGDCRPIHQPLRALCAIYQIDLWVLEEGYYRPNYFTLERNGVNANSQLQFSLPVEEPITPNVALDTVKDPSSLAQYKSYGFMVKWAISYWFINLVYAFSYPNYDHHRELNLTQALRWTLSLMRYWRFRLTERFLKARIKSKTLLGCKPQDYFLFPLQVHDDPQMTNHSDFPSVESAIEEVVNSFFLHLQTTNNQNQVLIIKHHPMNRGHRDYREFIRSLCKSLQIQKQVVYIHDIKLPLVLPLIKGCVTVNSTLGLQALFYGVPVINLGRSFYALEGLTYQGSLDAFWGDPGSVNRAATLSFRKHVIMHTQIAGCLYDPAYQLS